MYLDGRTFWSYDEKVEDQAKKQKQTQTEINFNLSFQNVLYKFYSFGVQPSVYYYPSAHFPVRRSIYLTKIVRENLTSY